MNIIEKKLIYLNYYILKFSFLNGNQTTNYKTEINQNKFSIIIDNFFEENFAKLKLMADNEIGNDEYEWNIIIESKFFFLVLVNFKHSIFILLIIKLHQQF